VRKEKDVSLMFSKTLKKKKKQKNMTLRVIGCYGMTDT
jgi:hypothetical protein